MSENAQPQKSSSQPTRLAESIRNNSSELNLESVDPFVGDGQEVLDPGLIRTFDVDPNLKLPTVYGVFLWWSDRLPSWIHPDDVEIAERLVPGCRVFRRDVCESKLDQQLGYQQLSYGDESFRSLAVVWLRVQYEGYEVGDRVEVKSEHGKRRPELATINDMVWNRHKKWIEYRLEKQGMPIKRPYRANEIRPAMSLGGFLSLREREQLARAGVI
ncbi:MAG: hypothetical protein AAFN77_00405 [Planctomycetota bacterium]